MPSARFGIPVLAVAALMVPVSSPAQAGYSEQDIEALVAATAHARSVVDSGAIRLDTESEVGAEAVALVGATTGHVTTTWEAVFYCPPYDPADRGLQCEQLDAEAGILVGFEYIEREGKTARVMLEMWYLFRGEHESPVVHQLDRVQLKKEDGQWVIENIVPWAIS